MNKKGVSEYDKSILLNFLFKGIMMFTSFAVVRYSIRYLGDKNYGIWVTVSSIISWIGACDLGVGNSLRNELAKTYAQNENDKEKKLIGTAIRTVACASLFFLVLIIILVELFFEYHIF